MNIIQTLDAEEIARLTAQRPIPEFQPGDTLVVNVRVKEGERTRVQAYEGVCIARANSGLHENFTVRKISYGEGVERVFPIYSPNLRDRRGKSARIAERIDTSAKAKSKAKGKAAPAAE